MRIERYRAQKVAAANAHVAAPKPTTALLLSEVQVTGIFRTPAVGRRWSKLHRSLPNSPMWFILAKSFFDGQLVAIEEGRLVFRRDIVWTDGRREKSVEIKPLRTPSPVEAMTSTQSAAEACSGRCADYSNRKAQRSGKAITTILRPSSLSRYEPTLNEATSFSFLTTG